MTAVWTDGQGQEVPNKRVILKRYVTRFPTEEDMEVVTIYV
jgi:hypothetical protein